MFLKAINKYVENVSILWPITHMRNLTFFFDFLTFLLVKVKNVHFLDVSH
jgi:hypothetical protein